MIYDQNLLFSNNQAITTTAASTTVIDLQGGLNINYGPNSYVFGGTAVWGEDIGIGDGVAMPKVAAFVTTTFTAGGAATLTVTLEGAPDTGSGEPTGTPGTYVVYASTPAIALANLVAGMKIAALDWPPIQPASAPLVRFLRLNYTVATGPMTAGKVFAGLLLQRQDNNVGAYPSGFAVGA